MREAHFCYLQLPLDDTGTAHKVWLTAVVCTSVCLSQHCSYCFQSIKQAGMGNDIKAVVYVCRKVTKVLCLGVDIGQTHTAICYEGEALHNSIVEPSQELVLQGTQAFELVNQACSCSLKQHRSIVQYGAHG